jgi:hypothetical protein
MNSKSTAVFVGLLLLGSTQAFAQVEQSIYQESRSELQAYQSRWSLEGEVQAQSVAGPSSPWFGAAGFYRLWDPLQIGLRGFLPLAKTVDKSSYAIQTVARLRLVHSLYSDLLFEPEYAINVYQLIPFSSYGTSLVVMNRLSSGLSVGVLGGIEMARVVLDSYGLERENRTVVYPKVAFLANFNF